MLVYFLLIFLFIYSLWLFKGWDYYIKYFMNSVSLQPMKAYIQKRTKTTAKKPEYDFSSYPKYKDIRKHIRKPKPKKANYRKIHRKTLTYSVCKCRNCGHLMKIR